MGDRGFLRIVNSARFNNALDIPPAGFSEGKTCPLPDHVAAVASNGAEAAQPGRTTA